MTAPCSSTNCRPRFRPTTSSSNCRSCSPGGDRATHQPLGRALHPDRSPRAAAAAQHQCALRRLSLLRQPHAQPSGYAPSSTWPWRDCMRPRPRARPQGAGNRGAVLAAGSAARVRSAKALRWRRRGGAARFPAASPRSRRKLEKAIAELRQRVRQYLPVHEELPLGDSHRTIAQVPAVCSARVRHSLFGTVNGITSARARRTSRKR